MKWINALIICMVAFVANAQQKTELPKFTSRERREVIDTLVSKVNSIYVFEDIAKKMSETIRQHQRDHNYDTISDRGVFAKVLTNDLQAVSKDGHLGVEYSATPIGNESPGSPPEEIVNEFKRTWARRNFCFKKVEILEGNIGLLQLDAFFPSEWIKDIAAGSMAFLANSDAVIIDLRENHGFAPDGVTLMQSYFFNEEMHTTDSYDRDPKKNRQWWTLPTVPGTRLGNMDLYILVSKNSFSASESFAYNLQAFGRAKIIGEITGGGAHGTLPYKIGTHFTATIPSGYGVNTVTHTDWEGTGVQPDVKVPADQALLTAQIMAIRASITRNMADTIRIRDLEQVVQQLEHQFHGSGK